MQKNWTTRFIGGVIITAAIVGTGSGVATATPSASIPVVIQAGAADDMSELDVMIMQYWIAQQMGAGFQRFLNGDGGGSGYEGDD